MRAASLRVRYSYARNGEWNVLSRKMYFYVVSIVNSRERGMGGDIVEWRLYLFFFSARSSLCMLTIECKE